MAHHIKPTSKCKWAIVDPNQPSPLYMPALNLLPLPLQSIRRLQLQHVNVFDVGLLALFCFLQAIRVLFFRYEFSFSMCLCGLGCWNNCPYHLRSLWWFLCQSIWGPSTHLFSLFLSDDFFWVCEILVFDQLAVRRLWIYIYTIKLWIYQLVLIPNYSLWALVMFFFFFGLSGM